MLRCLASATTTLLLLCLLLPPADAQQALSARPDTIDCRMLASMPNPPMTPESCAKMMAAHLDMMSALETPGGTRPGDERATCETIMAELKTLKVSGVSGPHRAEGEAAGTEAMAIVQRAMSEGMAMAGAQTARSAAAAVVPGNVAGDAAARANMAEQKALQDRTAAQLNPARDRMTQANTNSMADLTKAMRANPRFARLLKVAGERNCQG